MFAFFATNSFKAVPTHIYRSASALKIFTYIRSLNHYNISPEFASVENTCLIFENMESGVHPLQIQKNNKHLTGFFLSCQERKEFEESLTSGVVLFVKFLQSKGYDTNLIEQNLIGLFADGFQQAMLFFNFTKKFYALDEKFTQPNLTQAIDEQRIELENCFVLLSSWTQSLSKKWENETGNLIIGDELFHLTTRLLSIFPKKYILKLAAIIEKISDLELKGDQSYSLANLNSSLYFIKENAELVNNELLDNLYNRLVINNINCLILVRCLKYRDFILESINIYLFQNQLKSKKYIFNGYLFLQDETYFFNELLNLLSKNGHSQEIYDSIVIALDRLQDINNIAKQFTLMHCEHIELSLILISELNLFMKKKTVYPSSPEWNEFLKSEEKYMDAFKEFLDIVNKVVESYSFSASNCSIKV